MKNVKILVHSAHATSIYSVHNGRIFFLVAERVRPFRFDYSLIYARIKSDPDDMRPRRTHEMSRGGQFAARVIDNDIDGDTDQNYSTTHTAQECLTPLGRSPSFRDECPPHIYHFTSHRPFGVSASVYNVIQYYHKI